LILKGDKAMTKLLLAVLFGGCFEEHEVSVKSAIEVSNNIDTQKYEPIYIGITKTGAWKLCEKPCVDWETRDCCPVVLSPDRATHGLLVLKHSQYQVQRVDVVFPVLHGRSGEDGSVQGLLELAKIPYVGCDIQSSAICMDKSLTYVVARSAGIATPHYWVLDHGDTVGAGAFVYPVFVKPARSGSSFGVTKVEGDDELDDAIRTARHYDGKVLIEQAIAGTEVGCAVLGNDADLIVGEIDHISLAHGLFRIHQESEPEKGSKNATITLPADLPAEARKHIQETAKAIYKALGCRGLARVDMFLQGDGRAVLNEVNTLPGFTSYSRYPRMMEAAGMALPQLIDRLIALALER
jgi:D-alanine--(R)-lactate ligase